MASLRAAYEVTRPLRQPGCLRGYSTKEPVDINSILAKPTWSVRSLLPTKSSASSTPSITTKQLRHLLRLSALPQPSNAEEEQSMLQTLESQIHFVKEIQQVDTDGVEPLRSIRDETPDAVKETTIGLDQLREALAMERVSGRRKRIHRVQGEKNIRPDGETWDGNALGSASKTKGRYFVVEAVANGSS
ncbi:hypothetical protein N7468_007262 [Penicillium chermesinum]|uniref:Glutamyl-tRNA amidotransferase complex subunit Gta3 domain-containing protein n=1 Tax=Penicillium chermesinum TaxID=63820 RepID=A0A9W9TKC4_9EURO|nr:uncharacterized protein N7468_007262 [Penicillium chermesinum]KAJ5226037.1 hypothetical protein N7468_007262 [Penicillium chermesinum]KAJ6160767.1 hypothetical protein N7470_004163 [Penicillium chermesinum]